MRHHVHKEFFMPVLFSEVASVECNAVKSIRRPGKEVVMCDWMTRTAVMDQNVVYNLADSLSQSRLKSVPNTW